MMTPEQTGQLQASLLQLRVHCIFQARAASWTGPRIANSSSFQLRQGVVERIFFPASKQAMSIAGRAKFNGLVEV